MIKTTYSIYEDLIISCKKRSKRLLPVVYTPTFPYYFHLITYFIRTPATHALAFFILLINEELTVFTFFTYFGLSHRRSVSCIKKISKDSCNFTSEKLIYQLLAWTYFHI